MCASAGNICSSIKPGTEHFDEPLLTADMTAVRVTGIKHVGHSPSLDIPKEDVANVAKEPKVPNTNNT